MFQTWTAFGCLFLSVILHTSALSFRAERLFRSKERLSTIELIQSVAECCFSWTALFSALRVAITPSKADVPACTLAEELFSSISLLVWSSLIVLHRAEPEKKKIKADTEDDEGRFPVVYVASVVGFALLVAVVLENSYPVESRIGMVCFFQGFWMHIFLQVWFCHRLIIGVRYSLRDPAARELTRINDDEPKPFCTPEMSSIGVLAVLSAACLVIIVVLLIGVSGLSGGIVFWEVWLLFTGAKALRQELLLLEPQYR